MENNIMKEENTAVEDPTLLLVTGSKNSNGSDASGVKKLAHALNETIAKHATAKLKCVGAAAVNRAVKSIIVAELSDSEIREHGGRYLCNPSFSTASFDGGAVEKTAIVFEVTKVIDSSSS